MRLASFLGALALFTGMAVSSPRREGASAPAPAEWRSWGGDPGGTRFSTLADINRSNVARLRRLWTYHTGERQDTTRLVALECTPLVVGGVLYLSTPSSRVVALDAETGAEIWRFDPHASDPKRRFQAHRGVAYWEGTTASGERQRQAGLALRHDPRARRGRARHLGRRVVARSHRRQRLVDHERRSGARPRLPPDRIAGLRLLRGRPARPESLRQLARRPGRRDRK